MVKDLLLEKAHRRGCRLELRSDNTAVLSRWVRNVVHEEHWHGWQEDGMGGEFARLEQALARIELRCYGGATATVQPPQPHPLEGDPRWGAW